MMKIADTIIFCDQDRNEDAVAIVRYNADSVCICISLKSGGDLEVAMKKNDAKRLAKALDMALFEAYSL